MADSAAFPRPVGARPTPPFLVRLLASHGLCVVLVLLLALLTFLGTLEQGTLGLYRTQQRYFESLFLIHRVATPFGRVPLPLPGATSVLALLFVNLLVGGVVRLRRGRSTLGVRFVHLGVGALLVSGFVKTVFSQEGHVTLFEGESADTFQSWSRWELVVFERLDGARVREHRVPLVGLETRELAEPARLDDPALPFELVLERFLPNARPLPKGPMFDVDVPVVDGVFLNALPFEPEIERNLAGAYVRAVPRAVAGEPAGPSGLLWGAASAPWTIPGFERFAVGLRKERYPMPFRLQLERFEKSEHPGTSIPRSFASEVSVLEQGVARAVRIEMNEPLRADGLVLYQASWGPGNARPGEPLFSTFAVVRNPADRVPIAACVVIALGLAVHFGAKLRRHVRGELRRGERAAAREAEGAEPARVAA